MAKASKDTRIKREVKRLTDLLSDLNEHKTKGVKSLVENAAFMSITLEDLQETINEKGVVSEYQNGENQWGTKKSPEVEIYNTMIKNHMSAIKQLTDLLPKDGDEGADELMAFLAGGKK